RACLCFRTKLEKMPSIPEEPEMLESEVERRTMPDFIKPLGDVEVIEGKEAVLKCKVAGLPYPTISCHFTFVYDDPEYSLVILSAQPEHSGVYTCTAQNLAGSCSCKAELTVHTGLGSGRRQQGERRTD
uniref:Ig-like domain-containing protein n=1 Tax=Oryzias latipes TaxID=8090 RepID=A0A3P9IKQ0_ORYLA